MPDNDSQFLAVPASEWLAANDSAFVIADRFPVSPGHALAVPRRVIATWWEAADGVVYTGNFVKIALNVAHRAGQPGNVLADLLRSWFGAGAGQPGTVQYVELVPGEPHWQMRPASPVAGRGESVG